MSLEAFKPIQGYENYTISTWGRVYNIKKGQFLIPEIHDKGYLRVDLYDNSGQRKHAKIHRLVAKAFVSNPMNKPHVNHIDGNNQNNSFTNLEWVTDAENKEKRIELKKLVEKAE